MRGRRGDSHEEGGSFVPQEQCDHRPEGEVPPRTLEQLARGRCGAAVEKRDRAIEGQAEVNSWPTGAFSKRTPERAEAD